MAQLGQKTPAGWYPDPLQPGWLRWWSGNHWSAVCATVEALSSPDPRSIAPCTTARISVAVTPERAPLEPVPVPVPGAPWQPTAISSAPWQPTAAARPPAPRYRSAAVNVAANPNRWDGRYQMTPRALSEIAREPAAVDQLAGRYQISAVPVREAFVPRWERPARSPATGSGFGFGDGEVVPMWIPTAILATLLAVVALLAAASAGQGPLRGLWAQALG